MLYMMASVLTPDAIWEFLHGNIYVKWHDVSSLCATNITNNTFLITNTLCRDIDGCAPTSYDQL